MYELQGGYISKHEKNDMNAECSRKNENVCGMRLRQLGIHDTWEMWNAKKYAMSMRRMAEGT